MYLFAEMAELADAHGSGPCDSNIMRVQVPFSARLKSLILGTFFLPIFPKIGITGRTLLCRTIPFAIIIPIISFTTTYTVTFMTMLKYLTMQYTKTTSIGGKEYDQLRPVLENFKSIT